MIRIACYATAVAAALVTLAPSGVMARGLHASIGKTLAVIGPHVPPTPPSPHQGPHCCHNGPWSNGPHIGYHPF
jgi:hypothetical protein